MSRQKLLPFEDRFWSYVDKQFCGCWLWRGAANASGYGYIAKRDATYPRGTKGLRVHRVAYEMSKGPIPLGLEIDHLCRARNCVNPGHLEAVSHKENVLRGTGFPVEQKSKTHCKRGHLLAGDNLIPSKLKSGQRACKACGHAQSMAWSANNKNKKKREVCHRSLGL